MRGCETRKAKNPDARHIGHGKAGIISSRTGTGVAPAPRPSAECSVDREQRYYPELPVGLKLGGKLSGTLEGVTNKVVIATARR